MKHLLRCYMRKFVCLMKGRLHCFVEFVILQGFSLRAEAWDTIFPWSSCASRGRWLDLLKIFFKYFRSVQHGRVLSVAPCQIPRCSYPGQTVSVLKMQIFRIFPHYAGEKNSMVVMKEAWGFEEASVDLVHKQMISLRVLCCCPPLAQRNSEKVSLEQQ